jgi:hypothetical protein
VRGENSPVFSNLAIPVMYLPGREARPGEAGPIIGKSLLEAGEPIAGVFYVGSGSVHKSKA